MKKGTFYIALNGGKFELTSGYIDNITDTSTNTTHSIGYYKNKYSGWVATHIETGCAVAYGNTRKECKAQAQERANKLTEYIQRPAALKITAKLKRYKEKKAV